MGLNGAARWANTEDLQSAGMANGDGLILGRLPGLFSDPWITDDSENHIFTLAPPGTGKSTALVVPNLLTFRGSLVVTDPKGELTPITARYRKEQLGQPIIILNPWRAEMTDAFGIDYGDTGFNPLRILRDNASLHDNAKMIAWLLCPTAHDEKDPYWPQAARSVLIGTLLWMVKTRETVTLPRLAALVRKPRDAWIDFVAEMKSHGGLLAEYGAEIETPLESERQWAGVLSKAQIATDIYRAGDPLGEHVARDEFDPDDLKRQDLTVYVLIPSNRRDPNKAWLSLVMASIAEAVGRPGPARPVLLLAEEFANLGHMPTISRAMAEYRGAGLKVWIIAQTLEKLETLYGREGMRELLNLCGIRQFFGVDNHATAQALSEMAGQKTVQSESQTLSFGQDFSSSRNTSETGVPLIRPEEILNLNTDQQIILKRGPVPPLLAELVPYFKDPELKARAGDNPYRKDQPAKTAHQIETAQEDPRNAFDKTVMQLHQLPLPLRGALAAGLLAAAVFGHSFFSLLFMLLFVYLPLGLIGASVLASVWPGRSSPVYLLVQIVDAIPVRGNVAILVGVILMIVGISSDNLWETCVFGIIGGSLIAKGTSS